MGWDGISEKENEVIAEYLQLILDNKEQSSLNSNFKSTENPR